MDTNILLRLAVRDDEDQLNAVEKLLKKASVVAIALPTLCEFVWVLKRVYKFSTSQMMIALYALLETNLVTVNRPAVEAGLAVLKAGGDFADGVIAFESKWLGGDTFVSFDKQAVALLKAQGYDAKLLI